jgi:hypothetical protein
LTSSRSQPNLPHTPVPGAISGDSVRYGGAGEVDTGCVPDPLKIPLPPSHPPSYVESKNS